MILCGDCSWARQGSTELPYATQLPLKPGGFSYSFAVASSQTTRWWSEPVTSSTLAVCVLKCGE